MSDQKIQKTAQKVWVVFSGQADLPWLKIFKPGFRHCFVLLDDGSHWITVDPLSNYTEVLIHKVPHEFNMPLWLKDRGYKILKASLDRKRNSAPWMVFTCVEAVKRVLGLHKRFIFTPWQLYRHLIKSQASHSLSYSDDGSNSKGELVWEV